MKLSQLQDELEELETNLLIIYETANLLAISASADILDTKNIDWILMGMTKNLKKTVEHTETLIRVTIEMGFKLKEL